ncbi:MAG: pantoate--beta-alanine ligase [Candidatus Omnitrophota bacterium]
MRIVHSTRQMRSIAKNLKSKGIRIGFVPTMGALHDGHLSLIEKARKENEIVVVSIFVNPAQFSPREDFKKYPRSLKMDLRLCKKEGVDFIFYPKAADMYPQGYKTFVSVETLSGYLCGKSRPGHFRGVTTVVLKLFNIVQPDIAYFGQKDTQQAIIIKKMVSDLNIPVKIKVMPIVREKGGLAMSSRNAYLNKPRRKDALVLYAALLLGRRLIKKGVSSASRIIKEMKELIKTKRNAKIDYICIVDPESLRPQERIKKGCLIALAVWIGKTRLIDNIIVRG